MAPRKKTLSKGKKKPNPKHVCHFCKKDSGNDEGYCYGCEVNVCAECDKYPACGKHKPADHIKINPGVRYLDI